MTTNPDIRREVRTDLLPEASAWGLRLGGACLVATPLLFVAAELAYPEPEGTSAAAQLDALSHRGPVVVGVLATLAMTMLFLPGLFATLRALAGRRGATMGAVAGGLLVYGLVTAHGALVGANIVMSDMARPGLDRGAMTDAIDEVLHDPLGAVLLAGHLLFALGIVLLGAAVWRASLGARWVGPSIVLAAVTDVALSGLPVEHVDDLVSGALLVAGLGGLGMHLIGLGRSDREGGPLA